MVVLSLVAWVRGVPAPAEEPASGGPPFAISRETTHITEPLTPEGWPDYAAAILAEQRAGVTPENNGAVLFWQALGPGSLKPEEFAALSREIGLLEPPKSTQFQSLHSEELIVATALWMTGRTARDAASISQEDRHAAAERISGAAEHPWTADQLPPLAEWVKTHDKALDLLVAAAAKPDWYDPPVGLLAPSAEPLVLRAVPNVGPVRTAVLGLMTRSMLLLGEGDSAGAWRDCHAALLLADHVLRRASTFVEEAMGVGLRLATFDGLLTLMNDDSLTLELAEEIVAYLNDEAEMPDYVGPSDRGERVYVLDQIVSYARDPDGTSKALAIVPEWDARLRPYDPAACDFNIVLHRMNEWMDLCRETFRLEDRAARQSEWAALETGLLGTADTRPAQSALDAMTHQRRSEWLADVFARPILETARMLDGALVLHNGLWQLTRANAALARNNARSRAAGPPAVE